MPYKVMVDDNFHYQDEDERTEAGTYETEEEAVESAKEIVLKTLVWNYKTGMSPDKLYDQYTSFGDDPFIVPKGTIEFSAWDYAKDMVRAVCTIMEARSATDKH
jgi:hypothetical protein